MNIGMIAKRASLPAKTIRYYEDIGLVRPSRGENGYRDFHENDLHRLAFIGRARALGFSIADCRILLDLFENNTRESSHVKKIAQDHLNQIEEKIAQLQSMSRTLANLVDACHGDHRPECPILDDLSAILQ